MSRCGQPPVEPDALREADYADVLVLNEAAIPAVSRIAHADLQHLHRQAASVPVLRVSGRVQGFAILLDETADYRSLNFKWFKARYPAFVYVDRIVVAPPYAGRGLGRALYAVAGPLAAERGVLLTCEVNLEPPNPESIAFHRRLGFRAIDEQLTEGGSKRVSLMIHDSPAELGAAV